MNLPQHATIRLAVLAAMASVLFTPGHGRSSRDSSYEPLQIIQTLVIQFPTHVSLSAVDDGEVRVLIWVDEQGKLRDWLVTGYSHPLFRQGNPRCDSELEISARQVARPACHHAHRDPV